MWIFRPFLVALALVAITFATLWWIAIEVKDDLLLALGRISIDERRRRRR